MKKLEENYEEDNNASSSLDNKETVNYSLPALENDHDIYEVNDQFRLFSSSSGSLLRYQLEEEPSHQLIPSLPLELPNRQQNEDALMMNSSEQSNKRDFKLFSDKPKGPAKSLFKQRFDRWQYNESPSKKLKKSSYDNYDSQSDVSKLCNIVTTESSDPNTYFKYTQSPSTETTPGLQFLNNPGSSSSDPNETSSYIVNNSFLANTNHPRYSINENASTSSGSVSTYNIKKNDVHSNELTQNSFSSDYGTFHVDQSHFVANSNNDKQNVSPNLQVRSQSSSNSLFSLNFPSTNKQNETLDKEQSKVEPLRDKINIASDLQPGPHSLFLGHKPKLYGSRNSYNDNEQSSNLNKNSSRESSKKNLNEGHSSKGNASIANEPANFSNSLNFTPSASTRHKQSEFKRPTRTVSPQPGPSGIQYHHLQMYNRNINSEAAVKSSSNEACSQSANSISPIHSPTTPGEACLVSSSTGHLDSLPPTPTNFQGNDVSCPTSPESSHADAVSHFILDSTIDSTSGHIIQDDNSLGFSTTDASGISTSAVNLSEGDDVELLMEHSDVFTDRNNDSRIFLNLSLNEFQPDSIDSSLSDDDNERQSGVSYIANDMSLAAPNDSLSRPSTSYSLNNDLAIPHLSIPSHSQPSPTPPASVVTSDANLGLVSLSNKGRELIIQNENCNDGSNSMDSEDFNDLSTNRILNHFSDGYDLNLNDNSSSNGENESNNSTEKLNNECNQFIRTHSELCDQFDNNSVVNAQNSLDANEILEESNLKNSMELSLSSHQMGRNLISNDQHASILPPATLLAESSSLVSSANTISLHQSSNGLNAENQDVSLLVDRNDANDGTLLMMVSSDQCIDANLAVLDDTLSMNDGKHPHRSNLNIATTMSHNLSLTPYISTINDTVLDNSTSIDNSSFTTSNSNVNLSSFNNKNLAITGTSFAPSLIYTNSSSSLTSEVSLPQVSVSNVVSLSNDSKDIFVDKKQNSCNNLMSTSCSNIFLPSFNSNSESVISLSFKNEDIFSNSNSKLKILNDCSLSHHEDFQRSLSTMDDLDSSKLSHNNSEDIKPKSEFTCTSEFTSSVKCSSSEDMDLSCDNYISFGSSKFVNNNETSTNLTFSNLVQNDSTISEFIDENPLHKKLKRHEVKSMRKISSCNNDAEDDPFLRSLWCDHCDKECKCGKQYAIQSIADKKIDPRAVATLPVHHLLIKSVANSFGVFTRRGILKRTRFGPLEGVLTNEKPQSFDDDNSLCYVLRKNKDLLYFDLNDEKSCNWMKFVRKAYSFLEMNCIIIEEVGNLFFLSTTTLSPHSELRVGYSKAYAEKYKLPLMLPTLEEQRILEQLKKTWYCFECEENFESSAALQDHLACHDEVGSEEKTRRKKTKNKKPMKAKPYSLKLRKQNNKRVITESEFSIHKCPYCRYTFPLNKLATLHRLTHLNKFESEDNLNVLSSFEERQCPQCEEDFKSLEELCKHVSIHSCIKSLTNNQSESFKCSYCDKYFPSEEKLSVHSLVHNSNDQTETFTCKLCLRLFKSNAELTRHLKIHYSENKTYDCPICRGLFVNVVSLKDHVPSHCKDGFYTCPTCHKKFECYTKIRRHIRSYHSLTIHKCPHCEKEMQSVDKLKIHLLIHSDQRDFACNSCSSRFKRKDKLNDHIKRIHLSKKIKKVPKGPNVKKILPKVDPSDYEQFLYKCRMCLLGFKRRGMLVNHLNKRHPNTPVSTVPELNQPILRNNHLYKCQYCPKIYKSNSKRKLHIQKNHPGSELPQSNTNQIEVGDYGSYGDQLVTSYAVRCNWCHKEYATNAKLLQHYRKFHPDKAQTQLAMANNNTHRYFGTDDQPITDFESMLCPSVSMTTETEVIEDQLVHANVIHSSHMMTNERNEIANMNEEELLNQAINDITPSSNNQFIHLSTLGVLGPQTNHGSGLTTQSGQQIHVNHDPGVNELSTSSQPFLCSVGDQTSTVALVAANGQETVAISIPRGQIISVRSYGLTLGTS